MTDQITIPLTFREDLPNLVLNRTEVTDTKEVIDRLVDMIIYTPRGQFLADPDFGFEYWNYEYANVNYRDFNNDHNVAGTNPSDGGINRKECEESIVQSLATYAPQLKEVTVQMEIQPNRDNKQEEDGRASSRSIASVLVKGKLEGLLGTYSDYERLTTFLMEPMQIIK